MGTLCPLADPVALKAKRQGPLTRDLPISLGRPGAAALWEGEPSMSREICGRAKGALKGFCME